MSKKTTRIQCIAERIYTGLLGLRSELSAHQRVQFLALQCDVFKKWIVQRPQWYVYRWGRIGLLLVGVYFIVYPVFPNLLYHLAYKNIELYPYETLLDDDSNGTGNHEAVEKSIPEDNRIVIPKIHVDMPIVEGADGSVLDLGIWRRPGTGTPGSGNMVLTGHRVGYAFLPEDVKTSTSLYNLDKLATGDYVIVYWGGVEYDYEITGSEIVYPQDLAIESQDVGERLTVYTCHPVGSNAQRLVYYGKRIISG